MKKFSKSLQEIRKMAEHLSEPRFNQLIRLLWAVVLVAALYALLSLVTALRWW